ncbi:Coenzyme A ligase [hydrothermal vent metagenome]|uniref:Coenzyme A ligase n=1 Tax=hydrothermal vent metagenome TaxID=652676 RepID=A0A3B0TU07_9ZZZZ
MSDSAYFDDLETRDPEVREAALFAALPGFVEKVRATAPGWTSLLEGTDPAAVTSRAALAQLPVLRKSTMFEMQAQTPPFGGLATSAAGAMGRLFASPGPFFEPEGRGADWWRVGRALHAAGFRRGDILHNSFSYHLTPGGFILDTGARALGCAVVPGGAGNTDAQVEAIGRFAPTGYSGVPDYLKVLLDRAAELGVDASSIRRALVSGGPLFPAMRAEYRDRSVDVLQCFATADLGLIAYETEAVEGMVVDEGVIVEIVRPGTGDPVARGEVGELVVTSFNPDYPMIRLATGDLSAVLPGVSPCGRTNMRIKGWMGRADQAAKVKGMFVRPEQIAQIARRHPECGRLRLVIRREGQTDTMVLMAETADGDMARALASSLRDVTKLRGEVECVAPGGLPNDGLVIADEREGPKT